MALRCSTCNINLISEENFVQLDCPRCLAVTIVRCERCRRSSNTYRCDCGFEGP